MNAPEAVPAERNRPVGAKSGRRRWLWFGLWFAFVFGIIFLADRGGLRPFFEWIADNPGSDKAGHFILIGGLAYMLNVALGMRRVKLGPLRPALGGLLVAIAMTIEEFSQLWLPIRKFDLGDLAANYAGILCAGWLARWWLGRVKP